MRAFCFWGVVCIYAIEYIGLGRYIPGAQKIPLFLSAVIILALLANDKVTEVFRHRQAKVLLVFLTHTALSISYAHVGSYVLDVFKVQVGYVILFISTYIVIRNQKQITVFMTSFVLYHFFIILTNLDRLTLDQRTGYFRAGFFLGDGNDLAWSLAIFLPFIIYLYIVARGKLFRLAFIGAGFIFVLGIIFTGSRGAFLSIICALAYLVFNARRKSAGIAAAVVICIGGLALAPDAYLDRIQSIGSYEEDSSALGRIMAWKAAMRMAVNEPLGVGAGNFNTAFGRVYRPQQVDERIHAPRRWISPHSIYFLVLGEYGIIGLITLLTLLYSSYKDNQRQVKEYHSVNKLPAYEHLPKLLPKYLNTSLVAYSVGGVFLGGIHYPHIYILTALILRTKKLNEEGAQKVEKPQTA